ncbi:hypothetical protein LCGC14_2442160 [marine sediment metagenome]|uniref:Uncharacterized protein n=1 Tax=marine sediment metagenome TaxID=412755 RepID=A0A0F9ECP4_9ZZZZ
MKKVKQIGMLILIFIAGGVAFTNLAYIKYGIPLHYEGGQDKFVIAVFLAVIFGISTLLPEE